MAQVPALTSTQQTQQSAQQQQNATAVVVQGNQALQQQQQQQQQVNQQNANSGTTTVSGTGTSVVVTQQQPQRNDNTKEKCRKFLTNLIELSKREPKNVEKNVRTLIQELVDANVEPEEFCKKLERLLNASPQPCLIGFLKVRFFNYFTFFLFRLFFTFFLSYFRSALYTLYYPFSQILFLFHPFCYEFLQIFYVVFHKTNRFLLKFTEKPSIVETIAGYKGNSY